MKHGTAVTSSMEDLSNVDRKALEKKLHDYRRRNKELLSLAKQLDGRQKALQIENDSLVSPEWPTFTCCLCKGVLEAYTYVCVCIYSTYLH